MLKKLAFRPGINKEVTRYTNEGGWQDCNLVRFRDGFPEKMGGWQRVSSQTYDGICRGLFTWDNLVGVSYIAVGTHLRHYVYAGGVYYDITPIRLVTGAGDATFTSTIGSSIITVTEVNHGAKAESFVSFASAATLGTSTITASVLNQEHQIVSIVDSDTYTIDAGVVSDEAVSGGGGGATVATYLLNSGLDINKAFGGWSADTFGADPWGQSSDEDIFTGVAVWSYGNFGEDLVFTRYGSKMMYWDSSAGLLNNRAVFVEDLGGATDVPLYQNIVFVTDTNRFVFALGTNDYLSTDFDPMLIRWSDQENVANWTPAVTNQSGSLRLSRGSKLVSIRQSRQEVLVWSDTALYSLQYLGPPIVWGSQIVGENITIASQNSTIYVNGVAYWMGKNQFYRYDGQVNTMPCSLRRYVFENINPTQFDQVFAGLNEEFYEIWWFYPTETSEVIDRYVVYNYVENTWYHGDLGRTAWVSRNDVFAATYNNNLVQHEFGQDDGEAETTQAMNCWITSADTDIDDGDQFSFIWRVLPDMTFEGSLVDNPSATFTMYALKNSASGYKDPTSHGGVGSADVAKNATVDVEKHTEQLRIRLRGRQVVLQVSSNELGVAWQLGSPRIDIRSDGRK